MSDRAEAAQRIAKVRGQMAQLAEWRSLASEARLAAIEAARRDLDTFVGEMQPTGPLADMVLAQARRLARRQETAASLRDRHIKAMQEAERRLKTAESLAERLGRDERDRRERHDLERLIESAVAAASASLP